MRNLDESPLLRSILCLLVAGAIGCGDGTSAETRRDGGPDGPLAPDTAKADALVLHDTAKTDAPSVADTTTADTPQPKDTAPLDVPQLPDVGRGETSQDSEDARRLDTVGAADADRADAPTADAPTTLDSGAVEVGTGVDGTPSLDALAMTMASITFRLTNKGTQTVYLRSACWIPFDVTSAADGTVYANQMVCACDCASTGCTGDLECGPCAPPSGTAVQVGGTTDLAWTAQKTTLQTKTGAAGPFQCVNRAAIPTGTYSIAVIVYPTAEDAVAQTKGKTIEQSFVLGTANATIAVSMQ